MSSEAETNSGLPAISGRDHASLALLPFTLALRDPSTSDGPITFEYTLQVHGKPRRNVVTLTPADDGQLPVHADQMVFLALLQLALRGDDPHERLTFHRQEVFDLLTWPRAGRYYERFTGAIRRLYGVGIRLQTALVARSGREYRRSESGLRIITEYHIEESREDSSWVEWGSPVTEAFRLGDFKRLDWNLLVALGNPLTAQLYRLLDRVTIDGYQQWEVDWQDLAAALGMSADGYYRPAKFRQTLEPHLAALVEHKVIDGMDYERGGRFVFYVRNYLRVKIREALIQLGVYETAAERLLRAHDEVTIMQQCDCLQHGQRGRPKSVGGYLTEAVRRNYPLRYASEEAAAFQGIWGMLSEEERVAYHQAGLVLCGATEDLFDTNEDPTAWSVETRAVVRFLVAHGVDPEEIVRAPRPPLVGALTGQE